MIDTIYKLKELEWESEHIISGPSLGSYRAGHDWSDLAISLTDTSVKEATLKQNRENA